MNFPDDHPSSATPFSGDDIFADDVISASPTTSERVVDTQSGYLVVLKKMDGTRVALSVKRRIGTPPSSRILLTPDEQVKLAKILAEARAHTSPKAARPSPKVDHWLSGLSHKTRQGESEFTFSEAPEKEFARVSAEKLDDDEIAPRGRRRGKAKQFPLNRAQVLGIALGLTIGPLGGILLYHGFGHKAADQTKVATAASEQTVKIDSFVRAFVADMLDFNVSSYKASQIHAMAAMTPELLERYWQETSFPLSKAQLAASPKGQTLIITKVDQAPGPQSTTNVDLFAELVSADAKVSTPVHLQLKLGQGTDNQLRVLDQKDLSSTK